jgi:hypothetical protein
VLELETATGRAFPHHWRDFLRWSNGASLFDNRVYLFGRVAGVSRSIDPDQQQPISLVSTNDVLKAMHQRRWADGWMLIGSVTGWDANYDIALHIDGSCALTSEQGHFAAETFDGCLSTIIDRIGVCFSCDGIIDESYAELEAALISLVRPQ